MAGPHGRRRVTDAPCGTGIPESGRAGADSRSMVRALIAFIVIFFVATFPATWLLMLFLGNLGTNVSYWGALPLGILVSALLGGISAPSRFSD